MHKPSVSKDIKQLNPAYQKILNSKQEQKAREFLLQLMLMKRDTEMELTLTVNAQTDFNTTESTDRQSRYTTNHLQNVSNI